MADDSSRAPTLAMNGSTNEQEPSAVKSVASTENEKLSNEMVPKSEAVGVPAHGKDELPSKDGDPDSKYVTGKKLAIIFTALLLSIFLVALDQTIVATALPKIVSQFDGLSQVTWVASAYFLTQAGCMLAFGQVLSIAPTKWVYMLLICIFELGSLLCGVAPSMNVLILGRAIAGVGGGGIFVSVLTIVSQITRLEQRPVLFGLFGAVFALSSVIGPLLGGAFTDKVSWRWCFYINLPIGAISVAFIAFLLESVPPPPNPNFPRPGWRKFLDLDWIGTILCVGMTTCLLLPLQEGGNTKAWSDPTVYALFPVFFVLLVAFVTWEWKQGDKAIMPLRMFKRRTQVGCCLEAFFLFFGMLMAIYYLPLWYQATKGVSATKSGLNILPYMLSTVIGAALSGGIISKTGRYWPFLVLSPLVLCVGAGLLFTVDAHTPNARLIGFQILYGVGVGGAMQNTIIAIQAEFADQEDIIPQATSLVNFTQLLGGVVGLAIAGTLFSNQIRHNLPTGLDPMVAKAVVGSVTVIKTLPEAIQAAVVESYVKSLRWVFIVAVPAGVLSSVSALMINSYDLRKRGGMGGMAAAA